MSAEQLISRPDAIQESRHQLKRLIEAIEKSECGGLEAQRELAMAHAKASALILELIIILAEKR